LNALWGCSPSMTLSGAVDDRIRLITVISTTAGGAVGEGRAGMQSIHGPIVGPSVGRSTPRLSVKRSLCLQ